MSAHIRVALSVVAWLFLAIVVGVVVVGVALAAFYGLVWPWLSVVVDFDGVQSTGNYQWWGK